MIPSDFVRFESETTAVQSQEIRTVDKSIGKAVNNGRGCLHPVGKASQWFDCFAMKPCQNKMKMLFSTLAVSVTTHSVKLVKIQLTFDELVKVLGGQRALLGAKYGASSEPVLTYDHQNTQYFGSLVVGTAGEEIDVIHKTYSFNLWVPNSDVADGSQVTISTSKANQAHFQDRVRILSSVKFSALGQNEEACFFWQSHGGVWSIVGRHLEDVMFYALEEQ